MTSLSDVLATKSPATTFNGNQTLTGAQSDGDILVKGDLTVSGNFYLRGNLTVMGSLTFSSCTLFTVTGDLYVQYTTSGTIGGSWYIGGKAVMDGQVLNLGNATVSGTPVFEPFTAATTTGTPSFDGSETTVTITTSVLGIQQVVRVAPFSSDIFIFTINSATQFVLAGDFTASFPNGTAIRLYDQANVTRLTFTANISGSTNFIAKLGTNVYVVTSAIGSNYVDLAGNVVSTYPSGTLVSTSSSNIGNSFTTFDFSGFDLNIGKSMYIGATSQLRNVGNMTVGGDLMASTPPTGYPGVTLTFLKLTTPLAGTNITVNGNIQNFASIDISGGNSSASVSAGAGGTLVVLGSVLAPYKNTGFIEFTSSYQAIMLIAAGGTFSGSTAFSGGAGGNIRVYGSMYGIGTLTLDGGGTSGVGGAGGAGGFLAVMGPLYGVGVINATNGINATITASGGSSTAGDGAGGAGGTVILHSCFSLTPATIAAAGGNANSSSATSVGGAGGTVRIAGGTNVSSITASGGNCGLTGSAGGTVYLSGQLGGNSVSTTAMSITVTGGRPNNTAVNGRTGGVGGTVNINAASGSIQSITSGGGLTTGGTGTNSVAGNGGTVTINSSSLYIAGVTMNGGSSLTTTGSFAGSPGTITATNCNIIFGSVTLRTTGQTSISGTAPTSMASGKGQFNFSGHITVGTLDMPTITGARIAPLNATNPTTFHVDALTTKATFEDHTGANPSASQTSLCRTRIYKYNGTTSTWYAVTTTAI